MIPPQKHPCRDCSFCQWCPRTRCQVCLSSANLPGLPVRKAVRPAKGARKYPCPDCDFCQWCADSRCRVCRGANF